MGLLIIDIRAFRPRLRQGPLTHEEEAGCHLSQIPRIRAQKPEAASAGGRSGRDEDRDEGRKGELRAIENQLFFVRFGCLVGMRCN